MWILSLSQEDPLVTGITGKFLNPVYMSNIATDWYVLFFYFLNLIMVGADLILYARNKKLDKGNGIK